MYHSETFWFSGFSFFVGLGFFLKKSGILDNYALKHEILSEILCNVANSLYQLHTVSTHMLSWS